MHDLSALFSPRSIALVGATGIERKLAGRRWRSLIEGGFEGELYPVHPQAREVRGVPAYPSLSALPNAVDLVVIAVPAARVETIAEQCAQVRAKSVVVLSAGFSESGIEGRAREDALVRTLLGADIALIGPNCAGIASVPAGINLMGWDAPAGKVGVISQSGNVALNLGYLARLHGGGFSRIVSVGNAAATGVVDVLHYLLDDTATDVVIIYTEGWRDGEGRALIDTLDAAAGRKPVILVNPGRTVAGRRAALSHTGALAAEDRIVDGTARQLGMLRTDDLEDAWHLAILLAHGRRPRSRGVYVLTDGGGHATLASDALGRAGLDTPELDDATRSALESRLPAICQIGNPLDFAGVAESQPLTIAHAAEPCLSSPHAGALAITGHFGGYHRIGGEALLGEEIETARRLADLARAHEVTMMVHSVHADEPLATFAPLRSAGIPVTSSTRSLGAVLGLAHRATRARPVRLSRAAITTVDDRTLAPILARAVVNDRPWLTEPDARRLLAMLGVELPAFEMARSRREARAAAEYLLSSGADALVMKRISSLSPHKSDDGGVALHLRDLDHVANAFDRLLGSAGSIDVLLSAMLEGTELALGAVRDVQFGPCVMLGEGGVRLEARNDVSFRPAPLYDDDVDEMITELRIRRTLESPRLRYRVDRAHIEALLAQLGLILLDHPCIQAIDLNPVIVGPHGVAVADAHVVLESVVDAELNP